MLTKTLRPANIQESRCIRALLRKHNIRWSTLYIDSGNWVIGFSKHGAQPDLDELRACPDWQFVGSSTFGGTLLVWVRVSE